MKDLTLSRTTDILERFKEIITAMPDVSIFLHAKGLAAPEYPQLRQDS